MSTTISIAVWVDPRRLPDAFAGLLDRLQPRAQVRAARLRTAYRHRGAEEIPHRLSDSEARRQLAGTVVNSNQAVMVELGYTLFSGRMITLDLHLYGDRYEDGDAVHTDGPLRLALSLNDLARPLREPPLDPGLVDPAESSEALADAEELFFRVCGLLEAPGKADPVLHGAMYRESGWPSAAGCAMLYHRDPAEFGLDFGRIWAEYQRGVSIPATFVHRPFEAAANDRLTGSPLKSNRAFYQQFTAVDPDTIFPFLDGLSEAKARQLAARPGPEVMQLVEGATAFVPDAQFHDFGSQGAALVSRSLRSVWQAYAAAASLAADR